ncbi:MinD/ParA family protein [Streptomyces sp. NPDC048527]|uniref:MinD/ParA family ATP-binding protein n=1 Tax=Streptomyces sp. NPDC048527 TaxID=3365568 RepID=UPI0037205905
MRASSTDIEPMTGPDAEQEISVPSEERAELPPALPEGLDWRDPLRDVLGLTLMPVLQQTGLGMPSDPPAPAEPPAQSDPPTRSARPAPSEPPAPAPSEPPAQSPTGTADRVPVTLSPEKLLRKQPRARSGRRLSFGSGADRRRRLDQLETLRTPLDSCFRIAVVSLKGGVGKTSATMVLGATLAAARADRVIAIDANPDAGTLGMRAPQQTGATVRDLAAALPDISCYMDVRRFTSQAANGLEVLANDADPTVATTFDDEDYRNVMRVLSAQYPLVLTDSGTGLLHSAMRGVLELADQLVIAATPSVDGASGASTTLDWLSANGYEDLAKRSVTMISQVRGLKRLVRVQDVVAHFESRCRAAVVIPFDEHLAFGAEIELDRLRPRTREAYRDLAALLAEDIPRAQREPRPYWHSLEAARTTLG